MIKNDEQSSVLHSWCVPSEWNGPTVIGGQGAWLYLADGGHVLDMSSLAECSNLGHQHPKLINAIKEQAERLCFVTNQWGAEVRAELAEALLEIAGFDGGRVFFTLAGADANEHAVKIARMASGKPQGGIICRDRSYHGASYFGMALSGDARTRPFIDAAALGVSHVPPPYAYRCPFGTDSAEACALMAAQAVQDAIRSDTVAVLMEPNAGTNGIVADDRYWPELRRITREHGVLLIADEVMSGFGRCGQWFAWQQHGADNAPDIITCAKGLTGAALPLGAVIVSAAVYARIKDSLFSAGLTYCGHPMSCAAGLAAIRAYRDEDLIARSRRLGGLLFSRLQQLQARHPVIGDVRGGHGLFAVLELVADPVSKTPLSPWPQVHPTLAALQKAALGKGISFALRGNLLIIAPPLVIEEQELWNALTALDALLQEFFSTPSR
jgi:taurine--2-oxoglutarate transaminase